MRYVHTSLGKRAKVAVALSSIVVSPLLLLTATGGPASAECRQAIGVSPMQLPKD